MTNTKKKTRPTAGTASDPTARTDPRERLRHAIAEFQFEEGRLIALLEARDRCRHGQSLALARQRDAEAALKTFKAEAGARRAYAFMNDGVVEADDAALQAESVDAKSALTKLEQVEQALDEQITATQSEIRTKARQRDGAMSDYVVGTEAYQSLLQSHSTAWRNLRTIKVALQAVSARCRQLPQKYVEEPNRSEPTDERVGYPISREVVSAWSAALAALELDADAELPASDGNINLTSLPLAD